MVSVDCHLDRICNHLGEGFGACLYYVASSATWSFSKALLAKSPVKEEFVVSGVSDIQGCVCGLHLGGVDAA